MNTVKAKNPKYLRFWAGMAEEYILSILAGSLIMFVFNLIANKETTVQELFGTLGGYIMFVSLILFFLLTSINKYYASLSIAFGSTRKSVFRGIVLLFSLLMLQTLALYVICSLIADRDPAALGRVVVVGITLMLFICGLGSMLGSIAGKFEKAARIIFGLFCGLLGGSFGFLAVISSKDEFVFNGKKIDVLSWLRLEWKGSLLVILVPVAVIVFLLGLFLYYRSLQKMEVKF